MASNLVYNINNRCSVQSGYYCLFEEKGGDILENDTWFPKGAMRHAADRFEGIVSQFAIQAERSKVADVFRELEQDHYVPFSEIVRFPAKKMFFRSGQGSYAAIKKAINLAASYKDKDDERQNEVPSLKSGAVAPPIKSNWSYDNSVTSFANAVKQFVDIVDKNSHMYTRRIFEDKHNMEWICGDIRPPKEIPCPGEPEFFYNVGQLKILIDNQKPHKPGGSPDKNNLFIYSTYDTPDCFAYASGKRLEDLSNTVLIRTRGFIFHRGNPLFNDVNLFDYDMEEPSVRFHMSFDCASHPYLTKNLYECFGQTKEVEKGKKYKSKGCCDGCRQTFDSQIDLDKGYMDIEISNADQGVTRGFNSSINAEYEQKYLLLLAEMEKMKIILNNRNESTDLGEDAGYQSTTSN